MKFILKVALAASLSAGLAIAAAPVAVAQKKAKEPAAPQLKLSDPVRKAVAAAQAAITAKDNATATAQLDIAQAAATTDDERYVVAAVRLPLVAPANDPATLVPLLDVLVANPRTPANALPQYNYFRGLMPYQQKKYAEALPYLVRARDLGYTNDNLALQIAQANIETGNVAAGIAELQRAIDAETAAGRKAPEAWYNYAIAKLYAANNRAETAAWLQRTIAAYPTPQNWRKAILVYREGAEAKGAKPLDRGQRIDLFRLMRATKSMADQGDYLEYADLANAAGLPYEAKAVVDEGRATGKIAAGNATAARILTEANNSIKVDTPLATLERQAAASPNGKTASQTADVYLAQGSYAKAIGLYQTALQKGGVDVSEVNLRLGMALTQAGQRDAAKAAFANVTAAPRSDMAGFWRQWVDQSATAVPAA